MTMKKFIRYLYQYQNGKKVQNVGFVRVEETDDSAVIQIYGKGFPAAGSQSLEILLFYMMGKQCVGISMGKVQGVRPMFGYRLEYTADDVGGIEIFKNIEGMILLTEMNGNPKWYGAVWNERPVDIEKMIRRENILRENDSREEELEEEMLEEEVHEEEAVAEEVSGEEILKEEIIAEEPPLEESPVQEIAAEEAPAEEIAAEEPPLEESPAEEIAAEEAPAEETSAEKIPEEAAPIETVRVEEAAENVTKIHKITRKDIAKLPRREWKLANNNFLLHGCYNYHHLISFEKEGKCWLGVPGIYDVREQRAAGAFGFGQFMKPEEGEISLTDDEKNSEENFGYWCRQVSSVI